MLRKRRIELNGEVEVAESGIEGGFFVGGFGTAADDECAGYLVVAGGEMFGVGARNDDAAFGYDAAIFDWGGGCYVDDVGGSCDYGVGGEDGFAFDDSAFDDDGAAADEAVVFDDDWRGLKGFEDATDTDAAAEVDVFADLGTGADGCPSVDHGAAIDVGADVDVGRHHDDAFGEEGAIASDGIGDDSDAVGVEAAFEGDFVVVFEGADFDGGHGVDLEVEKDGHFDPVVDLPRVVGKGLSGAELTAIEEFDGFVDGIAVVALKKEVVVLPSLLYEGFELIGVEHGV